LDVFKTYVNAPRTVSLALCSAQQQVEQKLRKNLNQKCGRSLYPPPVWEGCQEFRVDGH
jgi:hypothetical protein